MVYDINKDKKLIGCKRNIKNYEWISYFNATILIWGVMTLYYNFKGLNFLEISLLQSIGSVIVIILEIPLGWISDRYGHSTVLKISALTKVLGVLSLIVFDTFYLLIISEIFLAIATAAQSGADTALLYESLIETGKEKEYTDILARVRGRQSLIRILSRIIAPLTFMWFAELPFIISLLIYLIINMLTLGYMTPSKEVQSDKVQSDKVQSNGVKKRLLNVIITNKSFIAYSILSAFVLVSVSNYSQYISPFLVERGLNIKWLGIVMAAASLGDYLGTKLVKVSKKMDRTRTLVLLAMVIFCFVLLGGANETILGGAFAYFGINIAYSPFIVLLKESINSVIDNKYRATFLSVSSQFDELFSILIDPAIGVSIDILGFKLVYVWLGIISIFLLAIITIVINRGTLNRD